MHGDHCFGIPGVLRTIDAALRAGPGPPAEPIYIYGPPGKLLSLCLVAQRCESTDALSNILLSTEEFECLIYAIYAEIFEFLVQIVM